MKKLIYLLMLLSSIVYAQNIPVQVPTKGIVSKFNPSRLTDEACSDALNVYFDKTGGVNKRFGSINYDNGTPTTGDILGEYEYIKSDGHRYMLKVVGSSLQYTSGDGSWTTLISTLNAFYEPDFATWLDYAWITNGIDDVYYFDGSVILSSPTVPHFKYIEIYQNRLWGIPQSDLTKIQYTPLSDISGNASFSSDYVNQKDGDFGTGLKTYNGVLYFFKNMSIHAIIWKYALNIDNDSFIIRSVSNEYGSPYDKSIQEFNHTLVFWTGKNIGQLTATTEGEGTVAIVSKQIEDKFKNLSQGISFQNSIIETNASDFGQGQGIGIDTTTYTGSIIMQHSYDTAINQVNFSSNSTLGGIVRFQTFMSSYTLIVSTVSIYIHPTLDLDSNIIMNLRNNEKTILCTYNSSALQGTPDRWINFNISTHNIILTKDVVYYITVEAGDAGWYHSISNSYARGHDGYYTGGTWVDTDGDYVFKIYQFPYSQRDTSRINQQNIAGTDASTLAGAEWQSFQVDDTLKISTVSIQLYRNTAVTDLEIGLWDSNQIGIATHTITYTDIDIGAVSTTNYYSVDFTADNITLLQDTTYYVVLNSTGSSYVFRRSSLNEYKRGRHERNTLWDYNFKVYCLDFPNTWTTQYQSKIHNAGSNAKQWGIFTANSTLEGNSDITWRVSVSTSATSNVACSTTNVISQTNRGLVNSTSVPFILFYASMTSNGFETPRIDDITLTYGTDLLYKSIASIVHDDYYYIALTTPLYTNNGRIFVASKDFTWSIFEGWYPRCFTIYNNDLYCGDSRSTGYTHRLNIDGVYDDYGNPYDSYFVTKNYNMGNPNNDKIFDKMYMNFDNDGINSDVLVKWNFDSSNVFTSSQTLNLTETNKDMLNRKIPIKLVNGNRGKNIKLKLSNSTTNQYWDFQGGNIYYKEVPEQ